MAKEEKQEQQQAWLCVCVERKFTEDQHVGCCVDLEIFDTLTPEGRYQHVVDNLLPHDDDGTLLALSVSAAPNGKLCQFYLATGSFDLTVAEMQAAGMLCYEWEARGYPSWEEMQENEGWMEEEVEEAGEVLHAAG